MEENTSLPPQIPSNPRSPKLTLIVLAVGLVLFVAFKFWEKSQHIPESRPPVGGNQAADEAQKFSLDVNNAIDQFIRTRIIVLSPVAPTIGTQFTVSSIEHIGPGETLVTYSDTTATYTAKGVFEIEGSKNLNILAFDLVTSTPSGVKDEVQTLAEDYIRSHVSELSPEKEVLGGKFYVTKISFVDDTHALVEYEDGHIALRANVKFMIDGGKNVEVLSWDMISSK